MMFVVLQRTTVLAVALLFAPSCRGPTPGAPEPPGAATSDSSPGQNPPERSSVRIATFQLHSTDTGNFSKMTELAKAAKTKGAEIVVFPEESTFGWLNPEVFTQGKDIPGAGSERYAQVAKDAQVWVVAGMAERAPGQGVKPEIHPAYDSSVLFDPTGAIVLHHRQHNVVKNAFDEEACKAAFGVSGCNYAAGALDDVKVAETPFGRLGILVCADAYPPYPSTAKNEVLERMKQLKPQLVIVNWGVAAGKQEECGTDGFNATQYAASAAEIMQTYVVGANAIGPRPYGRFLPSVYCGISGYATPEGKIGGATGQTEQVALFDVPLVGAVTP